MPIKYEAWVAYPRNDLQADTSVADTLVDAERSAIDKSAVNCHRTVTVLSFNHGETVSTVVKGPYHLKPEAPCSLSDILTQPEVVHKPVRKGGGK